MSAIKGRARRRDNPPTVLLQARVVEDVRTAIHDAARDSGVSLALYLETFIRREVMENGELPVYADLGRPQQEELPIPDV